MPHSQAAITPVSINGSIEKDIDALTTRVLQDKLTWSGDYTAFVDNFVEENKAQNTKDSNFGVLRHRLRLGFRANPSEYFRFTGRIAAYKNFLLLNGNPSGVESDQVVPSLRPNEDPFLRIDRMYMDIFPSAKWVSGSFGIFPSSEGLPSDIQRLQNRKSTYPNMLFNTPFAAAVLALHPGELWDSLPIHFWYVYSSSFDPARESQNGTNVLSAKQFRIKETSQIHLFVLEARSKVGFAEEWITSFGYGRLANYKLAADPTIQGTITSNGIDIDSNSNFGHLDRFVIFSEFDHLFQSGFNLYASFGLSPMVNDPIKTKVTATSAAASIPGVVGAPYAAKVGLPGSIHTENRWGKALLVGTSYDFPSKLSAIFGAPSIGYDFYVTSNDYIPFYSAGEDITSRMENIGTSHRFFYTQPITEVMKFSLSYTAIFTNFTNGGVEILVPGQGPATLAGSPVVAATTGSDSNSISRANKTLHTVQLAWMLTF